MTTSATTADGGICALEDPGADESASHIAWVKEWWGQPEKVCASFGENCERLRQLKAVYDPTNLFRLNPNVAS
jgi:FAD/FMN-containing dehydrogenase